MFKNRFINIYVKPRTNFACENNTGIDYVCQHNVTGKTI